MSDVIDDAQEREAQYLAVCLSHARASRPAAPQERDADGGLTGMTTQTVPAHQEALRMPASWDAVAQYVAYVAARAAQSPAE